MSDGIREGIEELPDDEQGLYRKYEVQRLGGTPFKHDRCEYFVLDLMHDPFAREALGAYASACRDDYPDLAADLDQMLTPRPSFLGPQYAWRPETQP